MSTRHGLRIAYTSIVAGLLCSGCTAPIDDGEDALVLEEPWTIPGDPDDEEEIGDDSFPEMRERERCETEGEARVCVNDADDEGVQYCAQTSRGLRWHDCLILAECQPGEARPCEGVELVEHCDLYGGVPGWDTDDGDYGGCRID